jgi:hypothetical protein
MKTDSSQNLIAAPHEQRSVWEHFQHDHELIARLKITAQELDALGHCALLGTLACKDDLLFILRQIREATDPVTPKEVTTIRRVASYEDSIEELEPDARRLRFQLAAAAPIPSHPGSLTGIVQRRVPEQLGITFWAIVLVGGLMWNFAIAIARWRENFRSHISILHASTSIQSTPWYVKFDDFNILLGWELLFVGCIAALIYFRSHRRPRRLKVKPI